MSMNIGTMPVEITGTIPETGGVTLKIGDVPAALIEPKVGLFKKGMVYINLVDFENGRWENLIQAKSGDSVHPGCTQDPRLLEIAKKIIEGKISQRDVGTVYPPLEQLDN